MKTSKEKRWDKLDKTFKEYDPQPDNNDDDANEIEKIENSILDKVEKSIDEKLEKWENDRKTMEQENNTPQNNDDELNENEEDSNDGN